jgi:hypothetical protein
VQQDIQSQNQVFTTKSDASGTKSLLLQPFSHFPSPTGNVVWTQITIDTNTSNVTLYGSFEDYAEIDEVPKPIEVKIAPGGVGVIFVLPHFWVHGVIDPGISLF